MAAFDATDFYNLEELLSTEERELRDRVRAWVQTPQQISLAKMNNVEMALHVARTTRDILGAVGILDDYQCFRHMANLESVRTYEGTHEVHLLILGQKITGIPAFGG
jgi:glutaryl-CoA dehydrogenase